MARTDEIKFIDQHLEKVVLGLCALILVYGVFRWVVSAPLRTEVPRVDGRVVPAAELDRELLDWADRETQRKPPGGGSPKVYDYAGEIDKHRKPGNIVPIGNWGDHRQVMVPPKRVKPPDNPRLDKIRDILLTFSPVITEVKGARELINKDGGIDKLVFRGKAEFPLGALLKAWNKEFRGSAMDKVLATALNVEIEKREVLSNGALGPVTRVTRVQIPLKEGEKPVPEVVIPEYTGKNADVVRAAIQEFSGKTQDRILRPPYWSVWSQGEEAWTTPWIKVETKVPDKKPAPAAPGAVPAAGAPAARSAAAAPVGQIDDGTTELWFHDTDVIVQRKYSYRMRIVFVNPVYTYDDAVYKGTPKDALVKSIPSGWSQWVQADAIPRTTQYFVTGATAMGGKQQLYCTVFTRSLGQVVAEKFPVSPGRIIGGNKIKQIKNPANGQTVRKVVDFSTNAVVVHVDFSKEFDRMGRRAETRELTCLEGGKLVSHILVKDMPASDPRAKAFKALQALVGGQAP